jgi:MOSC domain-containing protein YiiM
MQHTVDIKGIYISDGHRFLRREPGAPGPFEIQSLETAECVAGKGLKGDRFFGFKDNYKGQITFFDADLLDAVREKVNAADAPSWATRRNVLISGIDLNTLIGRTFEIGEVTFEGSEECSPCEWMNFAIGEGAKNFLKGRGGLRARIITSGRLSTGAATLSLTASD